MYGGPVLAGLLVVALAACGGGGSSEAEARAELETRGFSEIGLVKNAAGYEFEAKQGGAPCKGTITIQTTSGARNVDVRHSCESKGPNPNSVPVCSSANPTGCTELALDAEAQKKFTAALALYERGCRAKEPTACNNLAFMLDHGAEGVAPDRARAVGIYEQACELGYGKSCMNRGNLYRNADPPAHEKALEFYIKACDLKETNACVAAGWAYAEGRGTAVNDDIAFKTFKKGCDEGSERACGAMASRMVLGLGVEKNVERGAEMMRIACDTGVAGETCTNLGVMIQGGKMGKPDPIAAHAAFEKGCKARDGGSCKAAGNDLTTGNGTPIDLPTALERYRSGCEVHDLGACVLAGQMLRDGKGADKDAAGAAKLFDIGCRAGWKVACDERKTVP